MSDIITDLYYLVDENLPNVPYDSALEARFLDTLSPEQLELFEEYLEMDFRREDAQRLALFRYLVRLGLHIP